MTVDGSEAESVGFTADGRCSQTTDLSAPEKHVLENTPGLVPIWEELDEELGHEDLQLICRLSSDHEGPHGTYVGYRRWRSRDFWYPGNEDAFDRDSGTWYLIWGPEDDDRRVIGPIAYCGDDQPPSPEESTTYCSLWRQHPGSCMLQAYETYDSEEFDFSDQDDPSDEEMDQYSRVVLKDYLSGDATQTDLMNAHFLSQEEVREMIATRTTEEERAEMRRRRDRKRQAQQRAMEDLWAAEWSRRPANADPVTATGNHAAPTHGEDDIASPSELPALAELALSELGQLISDLRPEVYDEEIYVSFEDRGDIFVGTKNEELAIHIWDHVKDRETQCNPIPIDGPAGVRAAANAAEREIRRWHEELQPPPPPTHDEEVAKLIELAQALSDTNPAIKVTEINAELVIGFDSTASVDVAVLDHEFYLGVSFEFSDGSAISESLETVPILNVHQAEELVRATLLDMPRLKAVADENVDPVEPEDEAKLRELARRLADLNPRVNDYRGYQLLEISYDASAAVRVGLDDQAFDVFYVITLPNGQAGRRTGATPSVAEAEEAVRATLQDMLRLKAKAHEDYGPRGGQD